MVAECVRGRSDTRVGLRIHAVDPETKLGIRASRSGNSAGTVAAVTAGLLLALPLVALVSRLWG